MRTPERTWALRKCRRATKRGGGRKDDDSLRFVQKRADGCLRRQPSETARSALPLNPSVTPQGLSLPSLFPPTLSRRLRSGLRGPTVEDRVVLKGTLKRMPLNANCAVRECRSLCPPPTVKSDRGMIPGERRFVETVVMWREKQWCDFDRLRLHISR